MTDNQRVQVYIQRGSLCGRFFPRTGWFAARVLAAHDPRNAQFCVVVLRDGTVIDMVNPSCVRAEV